MNSIEVGAIRQAKDYLQTQKRRKSSGHVGESASVAKVVMGRPEPERAVPVRGGLPLIGAHLDPLGRPRGADPGQARQLPRGGARGEKPLLARLT